MGHFSILYKLTEDQLIITAYWDNLGKNLKTYSK